MSKIGLNTLNSNPGRATSAPGFSGGNLSKAVSELKSYTEGTRKTKPSQKMLDLLEKHNVISKTGAGMPKRAGPRMKPAVMPPPPPPKFEGGKVNRLRKANRWADFSKKNAKDGIDLGSYGYEAYDRATNPMKYALVDTIKEKDTHRLVLTNQHLENLKAEKSIDYARQTDGQISVKKMLRTELTLAVMDMKHMTVQQIQ